MTDSRFLYALAAIFCFAALPVHAAGFQRIEVPASGPLQPLKGAVWYPCAQVTGRVTIGPYVLPVAENCPVAGESLPLVVISHGRGGTFLGHEDTAEALADAGFVAVAINHGDNAMAKGRIDDPSVFVERPADIKRVIDYVLGQWSGASKIDPARVGLFGFSRGGYTALVAIGANISSAKVLTLCQGNASPTCDQVRKGELPQPVHDPRVKAAVIADPLGIFFAGDSFGDLRGPVQLWSSERGGDGVTPEGVRDIAAWLPTRPDFRVVPNSQHFDFLGPCPAELAKSRPEICDDESGFDRLAFHKQFNAAVVAFFRQHLGGAEKP
jgi:predicted dienelactone hydrolase